MTLSKRSTTMAYTNRSIAHSHLVQLSFSQCKTGDLFQCCSTSVNANGPECSVLNDQNPKKHKGCIKVCCYIALEETKKGHHSTVVRRNRNKRTKRTFPSQLHLLIMNKLKIVCIFFPLSSCLNLEILLVNIY